MKLKTLLLCLIAVVFSQTLSQASITNITYKDDGDGAVVCPIYTWPGTDTVGIYGDQYSGPGRILFTVQTDTEVDPTIGLFNSVENDTLFAWSAYQVDIIMNKTFTISGAAVTAPAGWTVGTTQPGAPVGGNYTGTMLFSGPSLVAIGDTVDFNFALTFIGSVSFTEQLTPVPEPATGGLLLVGLLAVSRFLPTRKQQA